MFVTAVVVEQLENDGYLRTFTMWAQDGRPFTVGFVDDLEEPHRGPFHFLDDQHKEMFDHGFAQVKELRVHPSRFKSVNGEYVFRHSWAGIPTEEGRLTYYSLALPEFAVPTEIQFKTLRSGHVYRKHVVRDDQRNRFVTYLGCSSSRGSFSFSLEIRYRIDPDHFRDAEYMDTHMEREHDVNVSREDLFVPDDQVAVIQFLTLTRGVAQAIPNDASSMGGVLDRGQEVSQSAGAQSTDHPNKNADAPIKSAKLPAKMQDYSEYFDGAHLTDIQYKVSSLHWEYGLSVYAIAKRMGKDRKTIDEHLALATKKMEYAGSAVKRVSKGSKRPE